MGTSLYFGCRLPLLPLIRIGLNCLPKNWWGSVPMSPYSPTAQETQGYRELLWIYLFLNSTIYESFFSTSTMFLNLKGEVQTYWYISSRIVYKSSHQNILSITSDMKLIIIGIFFVACLLTNFEVESSAQNRDNVVGLLLRWFTCPLILGCWLLNHVIYLKLRSK